MPRIPRGPVAGHAYHVLNRGNGGAIVFHKDSDYAAFCELLATAKSTIPVQALGFCLMPNHIHLVVPPATDTGPSPFMQWWVANHVRRYHRHYRSHGHVWQGRFKRFPIQHDDHLLTVHRYVLRNPVRAGLVEHVAQWPWSSLHFPHLSDPCPVDQPFEWLYGIDQPVFEHELTALRVCNSHVDHVTGKSASHQCSVSCQRCGPVDGRGRQSSLNLFSLPTGRAVAQPDVEASREQVHGVVPPLEGPAPSC